jgi:hypothetical protein
MQGAQMLAQQIEKTYGKDAFAFLVDEGCGCTAVSFFYEP